MALFAGQTLGPYELLAPIGAGGMGEVWKARDTRLGRTVALKVSKSEFSERFEREARAVAALNHPNICTLHDVGPNYLVMEFVEGQRLKGPVPAETAVAYGQQILDALDAAHRKGITHRDLKPDNILVTKQGIKLLDFGLAKQAPALGEMDATLTSALTGKGEIAGTLQYMSPEQLQGRDADARSDLFAFGCVLYELISGKRAFAGDSAASVIAAILERQPEPLDIPPPLDRIIRTCLAKDPDARFQNALDLKRALEWSVDPGTPRAGARASRKWLLALPAVLASLVLGWMLRPEPAREVVRFQFLPGRSAATYLYQMPVLSPDGRQLAYIGSSVEGRRQMLVRRLDSLDIQPVGGTFGVTYIAWSPDAARIAFIADRKLNRLDVKSGAVQNLADAATTAQIAWGSGSIVYSVLSNGPLLRIPESGGTAVAATVLDTAQGEVAHDYPSFCPDGMHFLFQTHTQNGQTGLRLGTLGSPGRSLPLQASGQAACTSVTGPLGEDAYLLELGAESLTARRIDLASGALGEVRWPLASSPAFQNGQSGGRIRISASRNGVVAYSLGTTQFGKLSWYDRAGNVVEELPPSAAGNSPALSRDERYVAVMRSSPAGVDIWVTDLVRKSSMKMLFGPKNAALPIWSPDGSRIAFSYSGEIWEGEVSGGVEAKLLAQVPGWPQQYSPDGHAILFVDYSKNELDLLPLEGDRKPVPLLPRGPTYFPATFAPGGKFVSYTSSESGRPEVYVRAVPPNSGKWLISGDGGGMAAWRGDGRELYYLSADLKLMSVDVTLSPAFEASAPKPLFQTKMAGVNNTRNNYVPSKDGKRFLIYTPPDDSQLDPMNLIVNWPALLKKEGGER